MSDRIKGLIVVLKEDLRDDDAAPIIDAIRMLRWVVSVQPLVADVDSHIAIQVAKSQIIDAMLRAAREYGVI
jgi:hypothetical protein